jgi:hypothetical protein
MSISAIHKPIHGKAIRFEAAKFFVLLEDDREIGVPYFWFPRLEKATPEQRVNYRFVGKGMGIHWEELDEDISVMALLYPADSSHES